MNLSKKLAALPANKRRKPRKFSDEEITQVIQALQEGKAPIAVARALGFNHQTSLYQRIGLWAVRNCRCSHKTFKSSAA